MPSWKMIKRITRYTILCRAPHDDNNYAECQDFDISIEIRVLFTNATQQSSLTRWKIHCNFTSEGNVPEAHWRFAHIGLTCIFSFFFVSSFNPAIHALSIYFRRWQSPTRFHCKSKKKAPQFVQYYTGCKLSGWTFFPKASDGDANCPLNDRVFLIINGPLRFERIH